MNQIISSMTVCLSLITACLSAHPLLPCHTLVPHFWLGSPLAPLFVYSFALWLVDCCSSSSFAIHHPLLFMIHYLSLFLFFFFFFYSHPSVTTWIPFILWIFDCPLLVILYDIFTIHSCPCHIHIHIQCMASCWLSSLACSLFCDASIPS